MKDASREPRDLIFDADDTLWDSEVHFNEAFSDFAAAAAHAVPGLTERGAAAALRRAELKLIKTHGYGRRPYVLALHQAADELARNGQAAALHRAIDGIGERLCSRHCALLPGVADTIVDLSKRHRLILFTKGQRDEQLEKLQWSGLKENFERVETPREKDVPAYLQLIHDADLDPDQSWMIGNSPRSDINPAVRAGLGAVFVPYPLTWDFEREEITDSDRIVRVDTFRSLLDLF